MTRRRPRGAVAICALGWLVLAPGARAALAPLLRGELARTPPGQTLAVIVTLARQVDPSHYDGRPQALIEAERRLADRTQPALIGAAGVRARRFWIANALALSARPATLARLAGLRAVARVDIDPTLRVGADGPALSAPLAPSSGPLGALQSVPSQPGAGTGDTAPLDAIGARAVWSERGITGAGVRVGSIDTGVDPLNPDLAGKIAGWRDFVGGRPTPYDDSGHGTHTIGTMVGGSASGVPIGVAPGAQVVVAKAIGGDGAGLGSNLLAAAQWMLDPDGNPATNDFPAVVNNSWTADDANDTWFDQAVRSWVAAGIVPVFAAGNAGSAASTIGSPAGYPESLAVAAVDDSGAVAGFSSRGPVVWQNADRSGPAAGTLLTKPDLAAPGVGIVSTVGTGYLSYSGTSMAAPHVAGVVALVKQADSALGAADIEQLLRQTASGLGQTAPNPDTGYGIVSARAAVADALARAAPTPPPPAPVSAPPPVSAPTPPAALPPPATTLPAPVAAPTPSAPASPPAAPAPGAASPGLSLIYSRAPAAEAIHDGAAGLAGLSEARRQAPIVDEAEWPAAERVGKLSGAALARMSAPEMAAALREAWSDPRVGGLVGVDEISSADWHQPQSQALAGALAALGPDARRVILYLSPGLVGAIGRVDPRRALSPDLASLLAALKQAGAVELEAYHRGAVPFSEQEFATYPVRFLARWAPADPGALHLLFGPDQGLGEARLWSWARASPAGRAILANGAGAFELQSAAQGLEWLAADRDFLANPTASPAGGDLIVSSGGGLSLTPPIGRTLALTLARPARAVLTLTPLAGGPVRAIAKLRGPAAGRLIALPRDVRPGRYRIEAQALGEGIRDSASLPLLVGPDWATRAVGLSPSPALAGLYQLEGQALLLDRRVRTCRSAAPPRRAALSLERLALRGLERAPRGELAERTALMQRALLGLSRAARGCAAAPSPQAPPVPAIPGPTEASRSSAPTLVPLTLAQLVNGDTLDLRQALGPLSLAPALSALDPAALAAAPCLAPGAVCLALDRALLESSLEELANQNLLTLALKNLGSLNLTGLLTQVASLLGAGQLSALVGLERVGDRTLRLVPVGPLAELAGLPQIPDATIGNLQVVPAGAG